MANTISNHETQLLNYLVNQISDTLSFIKRDERSLEILTEGDGEFTKAVDEVIQSKLYDISVYKFRLIWLESQLNKIKSLNNL
tara:strand:- start:3926 stop:4174 length:249 start_codon:yes stop_codon:yes gene_type:complete